MNRSKGSCLAKAKQAAAEQQSGRSRAATAELATDERRERGERSRTKGREGSQKHDTETVSEKKHNGRMNQLPTEGKREGPTEENGGGGGKNENRACRMQQKEALHRTGSCLWGVFPPKKQQNLRKGQR
jgi:hypothetical protein